MAGSGSRSKFETLEAVASLFAQLQARIAAEEKLHYLAEHDDLTGLHNRRALVAHLSERLAGEIGPVPVLYLDLDRLKSINDYLGHTAGDWYIRVFAERFCLRRYSEHDRSARRGRVRRHSGSGDVARRGRITCGTARMKLRNRVTIGGRTDHPHRQHRSRGGLAGTRDTTDLLHRADEAVLTAKRAGGNQVAVSSDDISLKKAFPQRYRTRLQGDIDSEALLLHYLPEVDLWTGAIVGAEALVRWRHPTLGLLLPDSFIGVAESTNLAGELGRWVMRSACAEFSRWRSNGVGQNATLRINVSPVQLSLAVLSMMSPDIKRVRHRRRLGVPGDHRAGCGS